MNQSEGVQDRFEHFDRTSWSKLRESTPLTLSEADIAALRGINEHLDIQEVEEVYLPLSRLLNLHVRATQQLAAVTDTFLGTDAVAVPYVIGIGGSVAVGKSTTARVLRTLLSNWSDHAEVALVTTDGFLYPNAELKRRGLMERKGFPESYDTAALIAFLQDIKSGRPELQAPVYSHLEYDVVSGRTIEVDAPDILIVEGLNVLQGNNRADHLVVSDFFDFSLYVDAHPEAIKSWYVERFLTLRTTAFADPRSYFGHYADLDTAEAIEIAGGIWDRINAPNLEINISPTRQRAHCILTKGDRHVVERIALQKF